MLPTKTVVVAGEAIYFDFDSALLRNDARRSYRSGPRGEAGQGHSDRRQLR